MSSAIASPIRVGTAGWAYEDWSGIVYPARPPRGFDRLAMMASLFDTNEVNSTFYRIPPAKMTERWLQRVEHNPRFAFAVKLFRAFTHGRDATTADREAFAEAMKPLTEAGRLGSLLIQFPMSFHQTSENLGYLAEILKGFQEFPLAVEFRHASWDTVESRKLLARRSAAFVNIDQPRLSGNLAPTGHVTAPIAYFRFHGRNAAKWFGPDTSNEERYNYLYRESELEPWIQRIREASHQASKGVYAILNNHFRGQAVANALQLQSTLTGETLQAPESLRETYPQLSAVTSEPKSRAQKNLF